MASVTSPEYAKKAKLSDGVTYGYVHVPAAAGKPTLLLLHGAPSTSYIWHRQVEALPKSGLGLLAPDLLGYATQTGPRPSSPIR